MRKVYGTRRMEKEGRLKKRISNVEMKETSNFEILNSLFDIL